MGGWFLCKKLEGPNPFPGLQGGKKRIEERKNSVREKRRIHSLGRKKKAPKPAWGGWRG